jgi:hypothetical protein
LKGETGGAAAAGGDAGPGATPTIVLFPKPPGDDEPGEPAAGEADVAVGGDEGVGDRAERDAAAEDEGPLSGPALGGCAALLGDGGARAAGGPAPRGAAAGGPAGGLGAPGGATKPLPTPTIVVLRLRGTAGRGAGPGRPPGAGRAGSAAASLGGAKAVAGGAAAGPASFRTRNECPHFEHRIFSPEGGTRRSSIWYGVLQDSHSTFSIPSSETTVP